LSGTDWAILAVLFVSVLLAAAQGFFFEAISLAGAVLGYLLAAWGFGAVAAWYRPYVSSLWVADIAGFLTIFLCMVLLGGIAGRLLRWAVHGVGLRWFDRLLGAAFGLVRGVLVVTVITLGLAVFAPQSSLLTESQIAPYLLVLGRGASWLAPAQVRRQFRDGVETLKKLRQEKTTQRSGQSAAPAAQSWT
jgi:membrane protein required for colicin V production